MIDEPTEVEVCTACGSYHTWESVSDIAQANPDARPLPQQCRRCLLLSGYRADPEPHQRDAA